MLTTRHRFSLPAALLLAVGLWGAGPAYADDMDFGNFEAEEIQPGAPSLEDSKPGSVTGVNVSESAIGTSQVSIGSKAWNELKRNFGAGFFNFSSASARDVNRSKGYLSSYNYVTLEYRTGRGEKVFVRPAFLFQTSGVEEFRNTKQDSKFTWHDLYFGYSSYNLPWLPFNMDYKSEIRLYVPTSDTSQNTGMIARVRGDLKAHYPLTNRLTFLLWVKPDYYFQSRTAYKNARGFAYGNRDYGYEASANLYYQLRGGVFGWGGGIGHNKMWSKASVAEQLPVYETEELDLSVFLGLKAFGLLSHIGVIQTRDLLRARTPFSGLSDSETQYFARSYYRF